MLVTDAFIYDKETLSSKQLYRMCAGRTIW